MASGDCEGRLLAPGEYTEEVLRETLGMFKGEIERVKGRAIKMAVFDPALSVLFRRPTFPIPHKMP